MTQRLGSAALACLLGAAANADPIAIGPCEGHAADAQNLMMPPEESVRQFANGDVRLYWLDTVEPACCSSHLMVIQPAPGEPFEQCRLVSMGAGMGFGGFDLRGAKAFYDPAEGLTVQIPTGIWEGDGPEPGMLNVLINQATGSLSGEVVY